MAQFRDSQSNGLKQREMAACILSSLLDETQYKALNEAWEKAGGAGYMPWHAYCFSQVEVSFHPEKRSREKWAIRLDDGFVSGKWWHGFTEGCKLADLEAVKAASIWDAEVWPEKGLADNWKEGHMQALFGHAMEVVKFTHTETADLG